MAKYSRSVVELICELISRDSFTVDEVCKQVKINRSTYHKWIREKPQFAQLIKKAKERFNENLVVEAKRSLMKKIRGYDHTEIRTVYGKAKEGGEPAIKEQTRTKKHIPADTTSIIFVLTNKVPDEYKHRQELTGKLSIEQKLAGLTDVQLNDVIDGVLSNQTDGE